MSLPQSRETMAPNETAGSISPPALAPAAAHSSPMPNIAPRWVLIPEVAANMAASASRPMTLRRPIPQPRAPASAKRTQIGCDGRGAGTERIGVHVLMAAPIDMAHEPGFRPSLDFQEKAVDGTRRDGVDVDNARLLPLQRLPRAARSGPQPPS